MSEIVFLQKKEKGKVVQVPCEIDFLTSKDEHEACSFYELTAKQVGNPEIFVVDNTLPSDLANGGVVLGVRAETQLICIRILSFNRHTISEYKNILGERLVGNVACSDGCVVESQFRGNNLQKLTWFLVEPLLYGKYDSVVATVSPKNIISLKNLLACGFKIITMEKMYGNHERFILLKKLGNYHGCRTVGHVEINLHDKKKMMEMFSLGYIG
jgi:hypothetical protein